MSAAFERVPVEEGGCLRRLTLLLRALGRDIDCEALERSLGAFNGAGS